MRTIYVKRNVRMLYNSLIGSVWLAVKNVAARRLECDGQLIEDRLCECLLASLDSLN